MMRDGDGGTIGVLFEGLGVFFFVIAGTGEVCAAAELCVGVWAEASLSHMPISSHEGCFAFFLAISVMTLVSVEL